MNSMLCSVLFLAALASGQVPGPFRGLENKSGPSPQNANCVAFTWPQDLPAGTVDILTYGAPEGSMYMSLSLGGDMTTYALHLDDCTFIESSRDDGEPFSFVVGAGEVIEGWDQGIAQMFLGQRASLTLSPDMAYGSSGAGGGVIPPNANLIFDIEIME